MDSQCTLRSCAGRICCGSREGVAPEHFRLSLPPAQMGLGVWGKSILAFLCFRFLTCTWEQWEHFRHMAFRSVSI